MLRTDCIRLVGTTCSRSDVVINLVTRCLTTCSRLDTTTGNKQCERILISACRQPCYNVLAGLKQRARFYVCIWREGSFGLATEAKHGGQWRSKVPVLVRGLVVFTCHVSRDLKQAKTATAVNKQLHFTVKNKPHTTNYIYTAYLKHIL